MWRAVRLRQFGLERMIDKDTFRLSAECDFLVILEAVKRSGKYMVYVFTVSCLYHHKIGEMRIMTTEIPIVKLYDFDERHNIILMKFFEQKKFKVETNLNYGMKVLSEYQ